MIIKVPSGVLYIVKSYTLNATTPNLCGLIYIS